MVQEIMNNGKHRSNLLFLIFILQIGHTLRDTRHNQLENYPIFSTSYPKFTSSQWLLSREFHQTPN